MKTKLILFCILNILSFLTISCSSQPSKEIRNPFLYEISKNGKKSYLLGTIHSEIDSNDFQKTFWKYFDNSEILVTESNDELIKDFPIAFANHLLHQEGQPKLSGILNKAEIEKLKTLFKENEMVSKNFDSFSLDGIYVLLKDKLQTNKQNRNKIIEELLQSNSQLDSQLRAKAQDQSKKNFVLDNTKNLISGLIGLEGKPVAKVIKNMLSAQYVNNYPDSAEIALNIDQNQIITDYRNGNQENIQKLASLVPAWLLKTRNEQWMPKMISHMENNQSVFFAVGLLHVIVDEKYSLINILQNNGYVVRRMTASDF